MAQDILTRERGLLAADNPESADLERLRFGEIWAYFKSQDILFWLVCLYLFLEYVRPQTLYPALDVLPYSFIVILLTFFLLILRNENKFVGNIENRLLVLFSCVVLLSSIFAISPEIAFGRMSVFVSWVLIYFLIINIVNTENRFLVFMLMFLLYNFKMSQFAFRGWARIGFGFGKDGTGGGPGWFQNSGEFGIEMCVFLPLATYFILALKERWPRWKLLAFAMLPVTAITGIISSSSRGAIVGGLMVMAWMMLKSRKKIISALIVCVLCFLAFAIVPEEQKARLHNAGEDQTSLNRTIRWEKGLRMAEINPILGVGYGNWAVADTLIFSGDGALCHNAFVECLSELGYSGFIVYGLLILFTFVNNFRTRRYLKQINRGKCFAFYMAHGLDGALIGYIASGFFVTVLYYPYFWINLAMTVALNNIILEQRLRVA